MKAVVVESAGAVAVRDVPAPHVTGNALVQVHRVGICGTDVKIVEGSIGADLPRIPGHEIVGRVVSGAPEWLSDDARVLIDPGVFCGSCAVCLAGNTQLCPNGALLGRDVDGGAAEYLTVDHARLHQVPDTVTDDQASLLQVLGTCVHAQECFSVLPGQSAAVVGLGVSGFLHLQLLHARGAHPITVVTRQKWKRDMATELGASLVVTPDDADQARSEVTGGMGFDIVVECAGTEHTLRQAMLLAGFGATVVAFGTTAPSADAMPTYQWYFKELTIKNPRAARPRDYARAIKLAATGRIELAALVTTTYPLTEAESAFKATKRTDQLKVALEVQQ